MTGKELHKDAIMAIEETLYPIYSKISSDWYGSDKQKQRWRAQIESLEYSKQVLENDNKPEE